MLCLNIGGDHNCYNQYYDNDIEIMILICMMHVNNFDSTPV